MEYFHYTHGYKLKIPSKDTANPLSHQVIASSNLFSLTQAVAPVGNNNKEAYKYSCNSIPRKELETIESKIVTDQ